MFKTQLEQDASRSIELRNVIIDYVKEKELTLQLDLEAKEKRDKEEEEKKAKESEKDKKEEEKEKEPELYCRNKHRLVKCLGRDTCSYGGGAMCDRCSHGINLDQVD